MVNNVRNNNIRRNNNWRNNRSANNRFYKKKNRQQPAASVSRRRVRSSTFGSIMKTAASSIISAIPGSSILKSIADFVFKAVKINGPDSIVENGFTEVKTAIVGLNQILNLKRVHFILNSPEVVVLPPVAKTENPVEKVRHIKDKYMAYNIRNVTIELKPQNDVGSRQGQWAMAFIPYMSASHENNLRTDYLNSFVGYNDILRMTGAVSGQQTQTLSIKYSPQAHDQKAYFAGEANDSFGMLFIAYQDFAKPSADEFSPQEFAATLILNSTVNKIHRRAKVYTLVSAEYESLITGVEEFFYNGQTVSVLMKTESADVVANIQKMAITNKTTPQITR